MKRILFIAFVVFAAIGCNGGESGDGLTKDQVQAASRLDEIAKQSGGDWEKVSAADREYLIKEVSMGSEESAKRLLLAKSGAMKAAPGGAPQK
jgi:hypothetical protein